ncbi:MAG: ATP-binding cassette domain-containing protein [Desulfobacterales bacterium]|jgi:ABC-2 type transport system ATP-binding protein|nr:ATP-binding cassette domain-containing protein [Desulfobacteraceae bacterium]MBT7086793.1 ATP-binding cassette domain-containing protein [Desulfobacterales bacterium]
MIHVENLTKMYNDTCAVDQISLDIRKGEVLGLLGPNGAGKTTTMRMLTGFLNPTSGTIKVKDFTIDENPVEIKKLMGYLPESAPLYHEMLAYDYLTYVANIRGLDNTKKETRIQELADLCGINEIMHKPIGQLSKGYKQRVGLAHAMMDDPEILILDEPTSGLDPNQIVEIRDIIKKIGKEKTIILSTHILSEAEATCDRIVIINQGVIVADGDSEALKKQASGEYQVNVSLLNADLEEVKAKLDPIDGIESIDTAEINGDEDSNVSNFCIICRTSTDLRKDIYNIIKKTDWVILEFNRETRTLENIFRELTREN